MQPEPIASQRGKKHEPSQSSLGVVPIIEYQPEAWDLTDVGITDHNLEMAHITERTAEFAQIKETLTPDLTPHEILDLLVEYDELCAERVRLRTFVYMNYSEDTRSPLWSAAISHVDRFVSKMYSDVLFFEEYLRELSQEKIDQLTPILGKFQVFVEKVRQRDPNPLSAETEVLLLTTGATALGGLRDVVRKLRDLWRYELFPNQALVSDARLTTATCDPSPEMRRRAYDLGLAKLSEHAEIFGSAYVQLARGWTHEYVELRGYPTAISARNRINGLPDNAVASLLQACKENEPIVAEFMSLKAQISGIEQPSRYDLFAPLNRVSEVTSYDDIVRSILSAFNDFHPDFGRAARIIFDSHHVHATEKDNKRRGAFTIFPGTNIVPYTLMHFSGTRKNGCTLAHEVGHGVHGILSSEQCSLLHEPPLAVAETASVIGENLLAERIAQEHPEQELELLLSSLTDVYTLVFRQALIARFEMRAHAMAATGTSVPELMEMYLTELRDQFGPNVEVPEIFSCEIFKVSHVFDAPFYPYSYAFGTLAAFSMLEKYKEDGPEFAEKIMGLLRKGGASNPIEDFKAMDIDLCSIEFWRDGFKPVKAKLARLKQLTNHLKS